jgi:N-acetylglucosaminyl-diphospho-decaprenol L-rhamnosyltransferase
VSLKLLVVIVNYRTPDLAIDCLRSIESEVRAIGGCRVCLTDNLSPDDSVAKLNHAIDENRWRDWCDFRPLPSNGGFAYGNNEGIEPYLKQVDKPDFVLLLNPDTVVRPGGILALLEFMERNADVGIAGSRLEDPDGTPQRSAFRFPGFASEWEGGIRLGVMSRLLRGRLVAPPVVDHQTDTDWVAGASMMIRRDVFERVGLLDANYFMYFEEVDFCLRSRRAGFRCVYVPQSRVVHLVGQASGVTDKAKANKRRPAYWFDSRRRYFVKNHGLVYAAFTDAAFMIGFALWRARRWLQRKPDEDPQHFLGDFIRNSVFARGRPR